MLTKVRINPEIINWAITRAGYRIETIKNHFPKIDDWLNKRKDPTITQLEHFAQKVHIPFGYLFLDVPPKEEVPIPYFRTLNTTDVTLSLEVLDTIKLLLNRQDWLTNYLRYNEEKPLSFVGKYSNNYNFREVVEDIRNTLNLKENWASKFNTWYKSLEHLTNKTENLGIIIVFNSIVGNNTHRQISVDECRGFVLIDEYAPFMFINSADAKSAQMFTIGHELAHIWIGQSAGFDFRDLQPANDPKEIFCNQVAAEFLISENLFKQKWNNINDIEELSKYFKVSPVVIARRALDLGKISREEFSEFYKEYIKRDGHKKDKKSDDPIFYPTQKKRIGKLFISYVSQAIGQNQLLYRDAYSLVGLKGETFHKLIKK